MPTPSGAPAQFRFWNRPCKVEWLLARKDCLDPQRYQNRGTALSLLLFVIRC